MPILNRGLLNSTALTNVTLLSAGLVFMTGPAMALNQNTLPTGGQVIGGQATISQSGTTLNVTQQSGSAAINWQSFSIGSAATTNFFQPNSSSVAINRVVGVDPSQIEGHLNANGQVVLVNPNGILFSKSARVDVGGLVASTSGISEQNAIAGNMVFDQGSNPNAKIVNDGHITAKAGGLVALVAPSVINNGVITAKLGKVSLAAGNKWTLDLYGDRLVNFALNDKVTGEVKNAGVVAADGGSVQITANVAKDVVSNAIDMTGIVEASSVSQQGGTIVLEADGGNVAVSGKLLATGQTGGTVEVTGESVALDGATVNVSGENAGGTIAIGGESHGSGTLAHAKTVTADSSTKLIANATKSGNAGDITVWSDGNTNFAGSASAKSANGTGGLIETSGENLNIDGAKISLSGATGNGTWLLDPFNLTIGAAGASAIETGLASGNVLVETTATGADGGNLGGTTVTGSSGLGTVTTGTGDITLNSNITWNSANSLTLSAYDSIILNASIVDTGAGNINLRADNAGRGGTVSGQVAFNSAKASTGGAVSIYYDDANYAQPVSYSGVATAAKGVTGYMLVNSQADLERIDTNLSGTYALGANITATGTFAPIGSAASPFTGALDGNGGLGVNYTINNLTLGQSASNHVGLVADNSGTIRNITLNSVKVYGSYDLGALVGENSGSLTGDKITALNVYSNANSYNVGGLVGLNDLSGNLVNDSVFGNVSVGGGSQFAGGVIGKNYGDATNSSFTGTVTAGCNYIGGFVGGNFGTIVDSSATGYVTNGGGGQLGGFAGENAGLLNGDSALNTHVIVAAGNVDVGGFVGINVSQGTILDGTASGSLTAGTASSAIGGFAGSNSGLISASNTGVAVTAGTASFEVGGFAGYNNGQLIGDAATGNVTAGGTVTDVGGYVGLNQNATISGVSIGSVVYVGAASINVGGLIGENLNGSLINDTVVADVITGGGSRSVGGEVGLNSGVVSGAHITGLVQVGGGNQFVGGVIGANYGNVSASSFSGTVDAGCNYVGGFVGGNFATIVDSSATGYVTNGGGGQLGGFAGENAGLLSNDSALNTHVIVAAGNVDIGGFVGINTAQGTILGGTVSGSVTAGTTSSYIGGFAGSNSGLISASNSSASVTAGNGSSKIGGYAGYSNSQLVGDAATGNVTAGNNAVDVGGYVGLNQTIAMSGVTVSNTVVAGSGSTNIGGLVGENLAGTFTNSTSFGSVSVGAGSVYVGGFAGQNTGSITNSKSGETVNAAISGAQDVGGFAGANSGTITNGVSYGTVTVGQSSSQVGGFAGYNTGALGNDTASAQVIAGANAKNLGGLVGFNYTGGSISGGSFTGNVTAETASVDVGGFVGDNNSNLLVSNGSVNGSIIVGSGSTNVGGYIGYNDGGVTGGSYTGVVTVVSGTDIGGFVGTNDTAGKITNAAVTSGYVLVSGTSEYVGGFAGANNGTITGGSASGGVAVGTGSQEVGGFAGANNAGGVLANDKVTLTIVAADSAYGIGGVAGYNAGSISGASFGGSVYTGNDNGGIAGGVGFNDAGGNVSGLTINANVITGNNSTAIGGIVGLNGSDQTDNVGNFGSATASVSNSSFQGTVTVGADSFAVGGLAGWDSKWTTAGGATVSGSLSNLTGSGVVSSAANSGTTYIHDANQVGCEEVGGNCFGVAGKEVITVDPNSLTVTYGQAQNLTYSLAYTAPGGTATGLESGDQASNVLQVNLQSNQTNAGSSAITGTANVNPNNANGLLDYTVVFSSNPGTVTVNKALLTVTANGSQTYGGANKVISYTYTGLVNGNTSSVVTGVSYTTPVTSSTNVGTYAITATGGLAQNYTIVDATGSFVVNKAAITITANGSQTYGGANKTVSYTYNGLINGDSSSIVTGVSYTTPVTSSSNAGSYSITAVGGSASNYSIVDATGTFTVNKAALTITANGSQTYGGANKTVSYTYAGLVNGNTSSVVTGVSYTTPVTSSSNAGTYGITATGGSASNYTITDATGTFTVNKAALTVTANGSQTYGGANKTVSYTYTGLVNNDGSGVVTGVSYTTPVTSSSNAGTYGITATGGSASNYTITDATGTFTVNKATLTVTANGSQTYGGANKTVSYTYAGLVNNDGSGAVTGVSYTTPVTSSSNAGTYGITATGGSASNYTIVDATGTFVVNKANLTITANGSQTYGGANKTVSYTYAGLVNGNTSSVVTGVSYTTPVTSSSNVGTYGITATGGSASNYTITDATGTFVVNKAAITITANGSQTYGGTNKTVSYTFTGLINGDSSSIVSGYSYTTPVTSSSNAGTYAITAAGGSASNYSIVDATGTFVVNKAALTITAAGSQTYGGANKTVSYTYAGLVNNDGNGVVTGVSYTTPVTSTTNAGTYAVTATGGSASNYTITDATGAFVVNKAGLTITANGSQTYGGTNQTVSYTYTGLVNGNTSGVVTGVSYTTPVTSTTNAGTYGITATGGSASNYTITDATGTFVVNKAGLTITANGSQTYGGTNQTVSYTYTGLVNGNTSGVVTGVSYTTPVTSTTNAGTYGITATGGSASNYTITDATGTFVVNKANLTVTPNGSQTYGGTNQTVSYTYTGLVNNDPSGVVTGISYTTPATSTSNAGTYSITATGGSASNYNVTDGTGTYVVNKAPLTLGVTGSETYGGTGVMVTYTYTGLVNNDPSGVVTNYSYTTTATSTSNVGTYSIVATGGTATNYTVTDAPPANFAVTPAALIVEANDTTRTQGSNAPAFSATFVGLVNGDSSSVVTGLTYAPGDTSSYAPNVYTNAITVSGGSAQNYTLTYDPGTLTVDAAISPPGGTGPTAPIIPPEVFNPSVSALNSLLITFNLANTNNQVNCLKVNSEVRGVTTDSPIDCSAPLSVNGF